VCKYLRLPTSIPFQQPPNDNAGRASSPSPQPATLTFAGLSDIPGPTEVAGPYPSPGPTEVSGPLSLAGPSSIASLSIIADPQPATSSIVVEGQGDNNMIVDKNPSPIPFCQPDVNLIPATPQTSQENVVPARPVTKSQSRSVTLVIEAMSLTTLSVPMEMSTPRTSRSPLPTGSRP